ncbi:MAG TPA: type I secretion protein TolC [Thiotrichales bacterium]|nr:type I secretion protein TolC [Thiotrichales bacterium]
MKVTFKPGLSSLALFLLSAGNALALDLAEALSRAQQYDTTYQAAYAQYLASTEASSQSTAAILPQVGFNAFIQRGRTENDKAASALGPGGVSKSDNNSDGYSLNINQVIFDKSVFDNLDQGDAVAAKALADLQTARQDTILRVTKAYFDVLTAIDALETASAEKKAIGKQLEQSKERYNVGLSAITDVKEQQASYDIAVADEIIATNNLSNAREALSVIINLYSTDLEVVRPEIPLAIPEPMDMDAWKKKSLENNFSLRAAQYAVEAAQSAYDSSKGGHYPSLNLNASYGVVNSEERNFSGIILPANDNTDAKVILSLDIPLYSGGLTSSTVRQKAAELEQAQALLEQAQRTTIALARSAFLSVQADISTVKARKQAVISTQTSLDATTAGYDAGTRTSVDVLLSQRLLYSSQRDYYAARYKYITDSLELKRVAGTLTEADILEINKWLIPKAEKSATP